MSAVTCEATTITHEQTAGCESPRLVDLGKCAWFALCPNPATTLQAHPILGAVPICASCVAWYGGMS